MGKRLTLLVLLMMTSFPCSGCGGGGSNPAPVQPTKATLKLGTVGNLTQGTSIKGINVKVILPSGVSVKVNPGMTIVQAGVVTLSGVAATGSTANVIDATFTPSATGGGAVLIILAVPAGFGTGEFATVNCDVANGIFPTQADFSVDSTTFLVEDLNGVPIQGLSSTLSASIF